MSEPAEFMRYTAADAQAQARGIAELRDKLAGALARGDTLAIVDHAADLGSMLTTDRRESEALSLLREHVSAAESVPDEEPSAWFWNAYATAMQYCGQRAEAEAYFARALGMSRASGWSRLEALVLHHWGRSLVEQGRFADAKAHIAEALALRVRLNDVWQDSSRRALDALDHLCRELRQ
jgi:tetratricopeptide (TPR) repeat protein